MKIGIMPREQFQQRILDIAAGRYVPKANEPKIWFSSLKSLSEVLSDNNVRLLEIIKTQQPETIKALADLSGRQSSNLSRTLKTMERYGIIELKRKNKMVRPIVRETSFLIEYNPV